VDASHHRFLSIPYFWGLFRVGAFHGVRMPLNVSTSPADIGRLSSQERMVCQLVAEALTNREIAARMFLSPHTVNYHLRQIFRKLGLHSRIQVAQRFGD